MLPVKEGLFGVVVPLLWLRRMLITDGRNVEEGGIQHEFHCHIVMGKPLLWHLYERTSTPPRRARSRNEALPRQSGQESQRPDEGEARRVWSCTRMKCREKREISEKTRRPAASSGTISTCENPEATPPRVENFSALVGGDQLLDDTQRGMGGGPSGSDELCAPLIICCKAASLLASHHGDPDFRMCESCRTTPLVGGFSRGSPVPPALSFRHCSILNSITLIGSQDLDVKASANLFPHSIKDVRLDAWPRPNPAVSLATMQRTAAGTQLVVAHDHDILDAHRRNQQPQRSRQGTERTAPPTTSRLPDSTRVWSSAGMRGWGKRKIPEKTSLLVASSGTIPTCEKPRVSRPGIEPGSPWWESSRLTTQLPRLLKVASFGVSEIPFSSLRLYPNPSLGPMNYFIPVLRGVCPSVGVGKLMRVEGSLVPMATGRRFTT
ncbi:hypothetical protein PR048_023107 [Dryococelus australis]|uniref:Uncharacterized protein n=1 Tax=Dryococelus australis TaxID=614101 RepID=A0ABQ9GT69_9NEOP|nr:hypothetical protein PR048_023107 [Dryococelus australis]